MSKHIETIFDYNPTPAELKRFGIYEFEGSDSLHEQIERAKKLLPDYPDTAYYQLGILFASRGYRKKADEYYSKLKDKKWLATLVEDF
jgi:hypothetical protein